MFKKLFVIIAASAFFGVAVYAYCTPVFSGYTERFTAYRFSPSSLGEQAEVDQSDYPIFSAYGESFSFTNGKFSVEDILTDYSAVTVFVEQIDEGISYYAFSDKIKRYLRIKNQKVNLHIFVGKNTTTVGSPIIFGSF